jgi:hypothetical protein
MGFAGPLVLAAIGIGLLFLTKETWALPAGLIAFATATAIFGFLLWLMTQPRLAYEPGFMLVHLRFGSPIRVPIDVVECFFLGSGPLKLSDQVNAPFRTVSLIVRLAEKATDWADRPVKPALGRWAEGYIMIHGAWCEPLSLEVVTRLNTRLHNIQHGIDAAPATDRPAVEKTT